MSRAYYNENDPFNVWWLRTLIGHGLIAFGDVDDRSIEDVKPNDLVGYSQCHFFAGIGGWSHALRLYGWPDTRPIWTMSCPCQPFSAAGKGGGFADERHLWPAAHWLIAARRPLTIVGEQVASPDGLKWFDVVSDDLEGTAYSSGAVDICAAGIGAPHIRQRLYWRADSDGRFASDRELQRSGEQRFQPQDNIARGFWADCDRWYGTDGKYRPIESGLFPLANGIPNRMGKLRGYGNAIVPQLAAEFIEATEEK